MYLAHFRLSKQPFMAVAHGDQVYLGPRQSRALANLQIALATPDAIAAITGPAGVGKTTLVNRVLEEVAPQRTVARVGRTAMTMDQLLEHLLGEFGVTAAGLGRIELLRALRVFFRDCGADRVRALILVEDASILGTQLLSELESVTAADPDGSPGANIILMGPAGINELLATPNMEHVRQRTRLRQRLEALEVGEVAGYLKHQLAWAGGDFATIVHPLVPKILWHCSGGLPRIVNNLCETALTVAATHNFPSLLPQLVQRIAASIYGLDPGNTAISRPAAPPADKGPAEDRSPRETATPRAATQAAEHGSAPATSGPAEPESKSFADRSPCREHPEPASHKPLPGGPERHPDQTAGTASGRAADVVTAPGEAPVATPGTLQPASAGNASGGGPEETLVTDVCGAAPDPEGPSLTRQAHMATLSALNELAARLGTASAARAANAPGGAVADDVPSRVDPPGTTPVDPEIQRLAARVTQVANPEDLDELLAETLFDDVERERPSSENNSQQNDHAAPAAHAEGAAISAATSDRHEDDHDETSKARNAAA
jgi:general secretion pathway protein A